MHAAASPKQVEPRMLNMSGFGYDAARLAYEQRPLIERRSPVSWDGQRSR